MKEVFLRMSAKVACPAWVPEIAQRGIAIDTNGGNFLHLAEDGMIQNGTVSYLGKQIVSSATICIHSVARLARNNEVFKLYSIQQSPSTGNDISRRVLSKVRAIKTVPNTDLIERGCKP